MSTATVDVAAEDARREQLAQEIHEAVKDLANLEDARRHPMSAGELVDLETRISYKRADVERLEKEFTELIAARDARAEAKRAARIAAREAARPGLEKRRAELEQARDAALAAFETHLAPLAAAVEAVIAPENELKRIAAELEDLRGYRSRPAIEARLKFVLVRMGPLSDLDPLLGPTAMQPLAEAATALPPDAGGKTQGGRTRRVADQGSAGRKRTAAAKSKT